MTSVVPYDPQERELIALLGLPTDHAHTRALLLVARKYDVDPLLKEITLIPGKGPYIGVHGRLAIAHRTGELDGLSTDDEFEDDLYYKVRATCWRTGRSHPWTALGRVLKAEKKEWPWEIARARAVRCVLGLAFGIHDSLDHEDGGPPPDEYLEAPQAPTMVVEQPSEPTGPQRTRRRIQAAAPPTESIIVGEGAARDPDTEPKATGRAPSPANEEDAEVVDDGPLSLAQQIAVAARKAGIDDDLTRHEVIEAATHGRAARGKEVDPKDAERVLSAFRGLADGSVELRYDEDGKAGLWRVRRP